MIFKAPLRVALLEVPTSKKSKIYNWPLSALTGVHSRNNLTPFLINICNKPCRADQYEEKQRYHQRSSTESPSTKSTRKKQTKKKVDVEHRSLHTGMNRTESFYPAEMGLGWK